MKQKLKDGKNKKKEESNSEESKHEIDIMTKSISLSLKLDNKYSDVINKKIMENNG
jgi:hypothetical protein